MKPAIARSSAPGRIDFLGGVADYSGSLVLEMPIQGRTTVELESLEEQELRFRFADPDLEFTLSAEVFLEAAAAGLEQARAALQAVQAPEPVYYIAGCLAVFLESFPEVTVTHGLSMQVSSTVPQGMGVSSSAALEIATLRALAALFDVEFTGTQLARLGQRAENLVVGAPCGLMDQLSSAYGTPGELLPIFCRPDILGEPVKFPDGVIAVGWPSGVKHSVSGAGYGTARAATFMGKQIFELITSRTWNFASEITPSYFHRKADGPMQGTITGAVYRREYLGVSDPLSHIDNAVEYPIYDALRFPIEENERAATARALLQGGAPRRDVLERLGQLMYASHAGYGSIGLGTGATDRMVAAVEELGPEAGFYGARVSGGGCGGTVVVLLEQSALPALRDLSEKLVFTEDGRPLPLIW